MSSDSSSRLEQRFLNEVVDDDAPRATVLFDRLLQVLVDASIDLNGRHAHFLQGISAGCLGNVLEGAVAIDSDVAGQPEHALGDDVAQDLVGAGRDPHAG